MQSGALAFMQNLMRNFALFELRDHPPPSAAEFSFDVKTGSKECMQDILQLCEKLKTDSVEQLCIRVMGEMLLHLLCAQGLRNTDMLDSIKLFRNGKWEKLWKAVIKASKKVKKKKADKPVQPRPRTNKQDKYAQKCVKTGNYSTANQTICQEMLHACADDTIDKLKRLHPEGELNFDRARWPDADEVRAFWNSEEGQEKLEKFLMDGRHASTLLPCSWTMTRNFMSFTGSTSSCHMPTTTSSPSTPRSVPKLSCLRSKKRMVGSGP